MIIFLIRLIKHLSILLLISLPLELLGAIILLPVIIYCQRKGQEKLPGVLKWFDCFDLYSNRDTSTYLSIVAQGAFKRYLWLAFRNPCNYFGYKVLGIDCEGYLKQESLNGDILVGDTRKDGLMVQEVVIDSKVYYEYYLIYKWNHTKCLRFRMGWKIGDLYSNRFGSLIEQVFVLQPYKDYSGT